MNQGFGSIGAGRVRPAACGILRGLLGTAIAIGWSVVATAQLPTPAQDPPAATAETQDTALEPAAIAARLAEVRREIAALALPRDPLAPDAATHAASEEEEALAALEALLVAQLGHVQPAAESGESPAEPMAAAEPSVFALNDLFELRERARSSVAERTQALKAARASLASAREALAAAERARREARLDLERASTGEPQQAAQQALRLSELESRVAAEEVNLRALEVRDLKRTRPEGDGGGAADARIEAMKADLANGRDDSAAGFKRLLESEASLRRKREQRERQLATVELRIKSIETQYARSSGADEDLLDLIESLSAQRDTIRHEIALIDARIDQLSTQSEAWQSWKKSLSPGLSVEERDSEATRTRDRIRELEQAAQRLQIRIEAQDRVAQSVAGRLGRLAPSTPLYAAVAEYKNVLSRLRAAEQASLDEIASDLRMNRRYLDELTGGERAFDLVEITRGVYRNLRQLWDYEITSVDDSPITIGSLLVAVFLLGLGLWASRLVAGLVGGVVEQRFKLDAGAVQSIQTILFYVLLVSFGLLALRAVHFPLTAFTVLGGALAIGVGFGSQNVMNNFISGLILMLERPVRARDIDRGRRRPRRRSSGSARAAPRSASTDGRHIIVPNSFFLENNVVNWTLSDDLIRTSVAGRRDLRLADPTRRRADPAGRRRERRASCKRPAPDHPLRSEFGDNSLNFEVHFWVKARAPMAGAADRERGALRDRRPVPRARPRDRLPAARRPPRHGRADRDSRRQGRRLGRLKARGLERRPGRPPGRRGYISVRRRLKPSLTSSTSSSAALPTSSSASPPSRLRRPTWASSLCQRASASSQESRRSILPRSS